MTDYTRRAFLSASALAAGGVLAGCQTTAPVSGEITRFTDDGRPIATTRTEPLSAAAARYGITPLSYEAVQDGAHLIPATGMSILKPPYHRDVVPYETRHRPGTIVVDNAARQLFLVLEGGHALRYGISVGREGFTWRGTGTIYRKAHWPTWTPTPSMIRRDPVLSQYAGGYPPGPSNPLGARALYLLTGGADRGYRIHGTPEWWRIGEYVSSGCIRMINHEVIDLYERVPVGTRVVTI